MFRRTALIFNKCIEPFISLMGQIDLDEIGIKEKIKAEVERVKKFQRVISL